MKDSLVTLAGTSIPPEVEEFTAERGLSRYLSAVIELARQAFPSSALCVSLGQDAEDEKHQYVALDVEVGDLTTQGATSRAANLVRWDPWHLPTAPRRLLCFGLAMNWRDFLLLATRLAAGTTEAGWRTAVSRAYYAVFHVARRLLADLQFTLPRADRAHPYLVFRLSNSGEATVEQSGRDLDTLRRLRNRSDYDEIPILTQPQAAAAVQIAQSIIQALDAARQEPTRTRIRDSIIVYERDVLHDVTWKP